QRTLTKERVPFDVPRGAELAGRLSSVLDVIYLVFNEGYTATAGDDWMRPALCEDALRLGRILAELVPQEPEVHGLVALMEIQASRSRARVGLSGEPILLLDQNRALWDRLLIRRGLAALELADALTAEPSLRGYHLLPSVRGDFLAKLGRFDEARPEFERAASLTRNARERALLLGRARACAGGGSAFDEQHP